jgi:uncharacterized repeat protein (TIGR03803 family)
MARFFSLKPQARAPTSVISPWAVSVLYAFTGGSDGSSPGLGDLIFDQAGNIYGTTTGGGAYGWGTAYQLVKSSSGWTFQLLYAFTGGSDGGRPFFGLTFNQNGNLYGATYEGGAYGYGTVFELTPSGSGWTENTLYSFQYGSDGGYPFGGVTFDPSGNLYGTTLDGGPNGGGTVFELTPSSGGKWAFSVLHSFAGNGTVEGPTGNLAIDSAGNLYGATMLEGVYGSGNVFKLTPLNGGWIYTDLFDFPSRNDGWGPYGNSLMVDAHGNLFGTTEHGGDYQAPCQDINGATGCGVVYELTP